MYSTAGIPLRMWDLLQGGQGLVHTNNGHQHFNSNINCHLWEASVSLGLPCLV